MQLNEHPLTWQSHGVAVHGILREPADSGVGRLVVLCDPFAEEKKCAHRALVDAARALCGAGFSVLRFDYRGCGDSQGEFVDFAPQDWLQDVRAALEFGRYHTGADWVGLTGLRMGANLAAAAARETEGVQALLLWEPILDGRRYVDQNLRRSQIKAMLTEGEQYDARRAATQHTADVVDFDGYLLGARAREQLASVDTGGGDGAFTGPTLVLNIGPRDEPGEAYRGLAATFPRATAAGVRLEPFWNRIGLVDASPAINATLEWLRTAAPGVAPA